MEMCSSGHEEIVYDRGSCPLCEKNKEYEDLEERVKELEGELGDVNKFLSPELP